MANKEKLAMTQDHTKLAVYNNAVWCATVCGAHGWPGEFHAEIWIGRYERGNDLKVAQSVGFSAPTALPVWHKAGLRCNS